VEQALPEDLATIWQRVREEIRSSLPPSTYRLWLEPIRPVCAQGTTLYVTGPERVRGWVERRYLHRIEHALREHTPSLSTVAVIDDHDAAPVNRILARRPRGGGPNPDHTFERFVIGNANRLAHGAALAVAELPGEAYNPLFLHGSPGLGKTHLLGAIAHYLDSNHPELTLRYTTGERFTSEFVAALRGSGAASFKERHRDIDVLLIDDVQFLEDKSRTEEEFFHTFDALHETGSQIVLASDRAPRALSRLAERLRDRFEWGLCVELSAPDLRTKLAVLGRLAAQAAVPVDEPGALNEIATRVPANLRQLEGALTRVVALASITSRVPTAELAREALDAPAHALAPAERAATPGNYPNIPAIQNAVCAVLHLSPHELLSPSRAPRVTRARHLAMYLTRQLTGLSLAEIARGFRRDHSTVLHAVRRIDNQLEPGSPLHRTLTETRTLLDIREETS
jgi:chromosomal replication initiator protein